MRNVSFLAINTFRESRRSKVIYMFILLAALVILLSAFFGSVSVGDKVKVIKDFGLFSISIFAVAYAVFAGTTLIQKEIYHKTIYNTLSKPVRRWEFLCGKYFGILMSIFMLIIIIGLGLSLFVFLFEQKLDLNLFYAYLYILLEISIVCAAAMFFSAIVITPILSGIFTLVLFLVGRSIESLSFFIDQGLASGSSAKFLEVLQVILPNLNKLNISNSIVYGHLPSTDHIGFSFGYAAGYTIILLALASIIFQKRELN